MQPPAVPSRSLLRFLRSQTEIRHFPSSSSSRSSRHQIETKASLCRIPRRCLSTSHRSDAKSHTPVHTDSLWSRNRDGIKALPPPRPYHSQYDWRGQEIPDRDEQKHKQSQGLFSRILRRRQTAQAKAPSDAPFREGSYEDTSAQLFNLSRALSRSPSGADLKLRCTEFDSNGSVTLVSGEFKKSELIAKYGLLPRDLRKIDSSVLPHILVRPSAILINLLHLRVLIQCDRVLVFDAYGSTDSYTQSLFMYDLEGKLRQKADPRNGSTHLPYELRALEAVLISVTSGLEAEFALVRDPVTHILHALEEDIDREKLRHLLIHSKKLGTFEQKARLVRDAMDELLEADDDLAAMYLTERKQTGKARVENDHQEVEMLLESYHKICDEIVEVSSNLIGNIRNTEEVVKAILDANRNALMLLELKFSIGTLGLAGGTLIAGLYGMNLNNFIEETDWGFGGVTTVCFGLSAIICMYGMRKLHKVQKVRMWGEGLDVTAPTGRGGAPQAIGGRGNWRHEALESQAQSQRAAAKARNSAAGNHGPVLWPGMDGLGMHKLGGGQAGADPNVNLNDSNNRAEFLDTNSDADAVAESRSRQQSTSRSSAGPSVSIHDDLDQGPAAQSMLGKPKQKALIPKSPPAKK